MSGWRAEKGVKDKVAGMTGVKEAFPGVYRVGVLVPEGQLKEALDKGPSGAKGTAIGPEDPA